LKRILSSNTDDQKTSLHKISIKIANKV